RAQTALRNRGGDRAYEGRRSSRPLLSQRSRRRRRQRHPECHRLQSSARPPLAEDDFSPPSPACTPDGRHPASLQTGFLTADYLSSRSARATPYAAKASSGIHHVREAVATVIGSRAE